MLLRLRAINVPCLLAAVAAFGTGCAAHVPEAVRTRDYFGQDIDFGFVTGSLLIGEAAPGKSGAGTAFPISPTAVVAAGHAFMTPSGRFGYCFLGYGERPPPGRGETVAPSDDPDCPWKPGRVVRLVRPDQEDGDFALIQLRKPLGTWDRSIDPSLRPKVGEIVVVGSCRGRDDDRVLTVVDRPPRLQHVAAPGLLPLDDLILAEPDLAEGWSGSPVKVLRRIRTDGGERSEWVTFGYLVTGCGIRDSLFHRSTYAGIVPLPDDVLKYTSLPPWDERTLPWQPLTTQAAGESPGVDDTPNLYIHVPSAERRRGNGVVLCLPGGAWTAQKPEAMSDWQELLSHAGLMTIAVGLEKPRSDDPLAETAKQVYHAVNWVETNADNIGVDPASVALLGYSSGGHLALLAGLVDPVELGLEESLRLKYPIAAVVNLAGPAFLLSDAWQEQVDQSDLRARMTFGWLQTWDPAVWRKASPGLQISRERFPLPTLTIHAAADGVVPVAGSRRLDAAYREIGAEHTLVVLDHPREPLEAHAFLEKPRDDAVAKEVQEFLLRHLANQRAEEAGRVPAGNWHKP